MNIIISDPSGLSVFLMPIVPLNTILVDGNNNTSLQTLKNDIRQVGNEKLKEISWNSTFPSAKNYSFMPFGALANGLTYVAFIKTMKKLKLPVRLILTNNDKLPIMNMLASIDDFKYGMDKIGDINYEIKLTEFPETFWEFIRHEKDTFKYLKNIKISNTRNKLLTAYGLKKP